MGFERVLGTISSFIRVLKLRILKNLISRNIFLQKYYVNVRDIVCLAELSIFKLLKQTPTTKKPQHLQKSGSANL